MLVQICKDGDFNKIDNKQYFTAANKHFSLIQYCVVNRFYIHVDTWKLKSLKMVLYI